MSSSLPNQVRLRIAGLYFNEIVNMPAGQTWTVREVMDAYIAAGTGPELNYDVQLNVAASPELASILTLSVTHKTPQIAFKFIDLVDGKLTVRQEVNSLSKKPRKGGLYRLQEIELDGGATVVAWQYYVVAENGAGVTRSATTANTGFKRFGNADPQQNGVRPNDAVIWRNVAIRRRPLEAVAIPGYSLTS